uniref:RNA-directed DNA polymerase n=1 Tax=Heligmosomoides polygyrus TaxID=6339 RepID=A0A8L8KB94_HELPZ
LGLDWIAQNERLFNQFLQPQRSPHFAHRLASRLQKQFPAVFEPGLGRCTKSKAELPPDYRCCGRFQLRNLSCIVTPLFQRIRKGDLPRKPHLPVSCKTIRTATAADSLLKQVTDFTLSGTWPKLDSQSSLWPFFNRRDTLTTVNGCLLTSSRIVIPKALQRRVLFSLHKAHPGQTRMKMLARSFVYWPTLDNDIEKLVKSCASCAKAAKDPAKAELYSWPKPAAPWTRVHADFAGPLDAVHYLIIVDAYSKWPEIIQMNSISTSATISAMKKVFSQFGNPTMFVTDNGTQFTSSLFKDFCTKRGIEHIRSPPFHPQSRTLRRYLQAGAS